ncbi:hypothetical protein M569_11912, partial [Genlisea aurea]
RDGIHEILRYATKNRFPVGLKEQMLAHVTLKFKTAELQQEEVIQYLPKAIRSAIAQHLFRATVENCYLFKGISDDFIVQLVPEMKAEYYPPKVEIVIKNEIPTDFYIIVSGATDVLTMKNGIEQVFSNLESPDMFGEIGVVFNIPQPFTVRTKRLSQVVRITHNHFKQLVQLHYEDGTIIFSNFLQHLKGLQKDELDEMEFINELLAESNVEVKFECNSTMKKAHHLNKYIIENHQSITTPTMKNVLPTRVILHGNHPHVKEKEKNGGKLVHLPDSVEGLLALAEEKLGKRGSRVIMYDGSQVEDLCGLRDNDHLYI